jgi:hypothetical protein
MSHRLESNEADSPAIPRTLTMDGKPMTRVRYRPRGFVKLSKWLTQRYGTGSAATT